MAKLQYYDVIKKPIVSESSMSEMGQKKYTFLLWDYWRYYSDPEMLFPVWTLFPFLATKYWNERSAFIKLEMISRRETRGTKEVSVIKEIDS